MTLATLVETNPGTAQIAALSSLDPANPFYTAEYVAYRQAQGDGPLLFLETQGSRITAGCTGFIRRGRLNTTVDIPSRPTAHDPDQFWLAAHEFCRRAGVTRVSLSSFASSSGPMPRLWNASRTKPRREYVMDLGTAPSMQTLRKGHAYEVKRAIKAGLSVHRTRDPAACTVHVQLMNASIARQRQHGKEVSEVDNMAPLRGLLTAGAGELFQASLGGEVVASSMVLLAPSGGYNHTQGTSPPGMSRGGAHFLIFEIARLLRGDGRNSFNLGGTDELGSGLERFKTGFGADVHLVDLEASEIHIGRTWRNIVRASFGMLVRD